MIKIWNGSQVNLLEQINPLLGDEKLPLEVIMTVKDMVEILDQNYGDGRHPEIDLGGSVCILEQGTISECNDYANLLDKYKTSVDMSEFTDLIEINTGDQVKSEVRYGWYLQVYILSSDYTLSIIYKDII